MLCVVNDWWVVLALLNAQLNRLELWVGLKERSQVAQECFPILITMKYI